MRNARNMKLRIATCLVAATLGGALTSDTFVQTQVESQETAHKMQYENGTKSVRSQFEAEAEANSESAPATDARINEKVSKVQKDRHLEVLRDQIATKEQRAEALQTRLLAITEKESMLVNRLTVLEFELQPENIERMLAGVGSTKPEDLREAVRQRLLSEQHGIQAQLELLGKERSRIQQSLALADGQIFRLRAELAEATLSGLM